MAQSPLTSKSVDTVSTNLQLSSLARRNPSLRSTKRASFDRFIPTRRGSDHETAHHLLLSPDTSQNDSQVFSPEGAVGGTPRVASGTPMRKRGQGAVASRLASEDKVLLFSPKAINTPPSDPMSEMTRQMAELDAGETPRTRSPRRILPRSPEKVLSMPDLSDDFYSNILSWSSQNKIAVAIEDGVYVWKAENSAYQPISTGVGDENEAPVVIKSVAWDPRGNLLAMGTQAGNLLVWRSDRDEIAVYRGSQQRSLCPHSGETNALVWAKTGASIFTAHQCGCVHSICVKAGDVSKFKMTIQHGASGLAMSPDNRYLAVGTNEGHVYIWGLREKKETCCIHAHTAAMKALAWLPWQMSALVSGGGDGDGYIRLWNTCKGAKTTEVSTNSQICCLVVSEENRELITGHGVSTTDVIIWTLPGLTPIGRLQYHTERVLQLALSPDQAMLASLGADQTLVLWKCFEGTIGKKASRKHSPLPCSSPLLFGIR